VGRRGEAVLKKKKILTKSITPLFSPLTREKGKEKREG